MARTAAALRSARSAALVGCAILSIGLTIVSRAGFSGPAFTPSLLAVGAAAPAIDPQEDVAVFDLEATDLPADYLLIVGSLGDAGQVHEVQCLTQTVLDRTGEIPLNRKPGRPQSMCPLACPEPAKDVSPISQHDDATASTGVPLTQRLFFIQLGSDPCSQASHQPVETRLLARSPRIAVWADAAAQDEGMAERAWWIVTCLEQVVLPKLVGLYGEIADLDGDGTLAVCLTRRLAEFPSTGVPVEGLVQFHDFQPELGRPFSNQADVMFLSADLAPGPHATAILAHEAAHLAVFSRRRDADAQHPQPDDDWWNEGLAHHAEIRCGGDWSNLAPRMAAFEERPGLAALVVPDAAQQGLWRDPAARGAAWAFVRWLAQTYGDDILVRIAGEAGEGCEKIGRITGEPFEELFRRWTVAMWSAKPMPSQDRRESDRLTLKPSRLDSAGQTFALRGSGHAGYQVHVGSGQRLRVRIAGPKHAQLQATVVEANGKTPRHWPVR